MPDIVGLFDQSLPLKEVLDALPIGLLVLDPERRIVLTNRIADGLTGFDGEQVRGLPCRHVLRTNLCHKECPALSSRDKAGPATRDGDIIDRERRKVPVRLTSAALRDSRGHLSGFLETVEDITHLKRPDETLAAERGLGQILGQSAAMQALFRMVPVIAQTDSSVLITGETGTGKDLLAEAIHQASSRSNGSFIKVNCGALPETLLESELFGHTKGAFTGATENKSGRIRLAHNGTFYLTEVGDLPLQLQVKLLTFLDDKVIYPLGSAKGLRVDVRVIAATHRDLESMVRNGAFREDLLHRLNVVRIQLPPLRERDDDVILLLDHFLHHFATQFGKRIGGYSPQVRQILKNYAYPGNVRELRNIVEYAANICQKQMLAVEHLPAYVTEAGPAAQAEPAGSDIPVAPDAEKSWQETERQLILDALMKAHGRKGKAAASLGWARSTLWRKMKQYGILP